MRKIILLSIVFILALTGCTSSSSEAVNNKTNTAFGGKVYDITTKKGVNCVYVQWKFGGGLSCNWNKEDKIK